MTDDLMAKIIACSKVLDEADVQQTSRYVIAGGPESGKIYYIDEGGYVTVGERDDA